MSKKKRVKLILLLMLLLFPGKVVLDALGFELEKYYSSEIDEDALMVTQFHHGNKVIQIGDITKLDDRKVCNSKIYCPYLTQLKN